jgi:hypothetical protein
MLRPENVTTSFKAGPRREFLPVGLLEKSSENGGEKEKIVRAAAALATVDAVVGFASTLTVKRSRPIDVRASSFAMRRRLSA